MKTFLEHLQGAVGGTFSLDDIMNNLSADEIVEEVKLYALEACKQSLRNASDNANVKIAGMGYIVIDHSTILSEENIPKEVK